MDDYLSKPVELGDLLKKLDQWLPLREAGAASFGMTGKHSRIPEAAAPTDAPAPIDRRVLAETYGRDTTGERDVLIEFRRVLNEDAVTLAQAVAKHDMSRVAHVSHRTQGASLIVGAKALAGVCARIEQASRANDRAIVEASMDAFEQELLRVNTYLDVLFDNGTRRQ